MQIHLKFPEKCWRNPGKIQEKSGKSAQNQNKIQLGFAFHYRFHSLCLYFLRWLADSPLVLFDPDHGSDFNFYLDSDMSLVCIGHCQGCKCPGMVGAVKWKNKLST